jgi:menaquinone-dependent protoporphyrinogen oxidase
MTTLVVYASKHGATQGIAERIGVKLSEAGQEADVRSVEDTDDLMSYEAFVIGSAVYAGHWQKEALTFVQRNLAVLASKPVWLFSSGPLGTEATNAKGQDLKVAAKPKEITEFEDAIEPKGHCVFFGALDPSKLGFSERAIRKLPAARTMLPEGDFRDWVEIDARASSIARDLAVTRD